MNWAYAFAALAAFLAMRMSLTAHEIKPVPYSYAGLPPILPVNSRLTGHSERMLEGQVCGPEHFVFRGDDIYSSLCDGRIVRTKSAADGSLSPIETVVYTGNPNRLNRGQTCGTHAAQSICGRPLGMAFDNDGKLIVADAYFGLLSVDVEAKTKTTLVEEVDGLTLYLPNSIVVGASGKIYFTDASTRYRVREFVLDVLESDPNGRVIEFDPATKQARVLVDEIAFANGILVDPTESFLIFSEFARSQLLRYDLTKNAKETVHWGSKRLGADSPLSMVIDNLPCIPDNLVWSAHRADSFWIGCPTTRQPFSFMDWMSDKPWVRSLLARIQPLLFFYLIDAVGVVLRIQLHDTPTDRTARATIAESLQDSTGEVFFITGAYEHKDGYMYLGNVMEFVNFLPRIKWNKENATAIAKGDK